MDNSTQAQGMIDHRVDLNTIARKLSLSLDDLLLDELEDAVVRYFRRAGKTVFTKAEQRKRVVSALNSLSGLYAQGYVRPLRD